MLHPAENPRVPYVSAVSQDAPGVFVAASDYLKVLPGFDRPLAAAPAAGARH